MRWALQAAGLFKVKSCLESAVPEKENENN